MYSFIKTIIDSRILDYYCMISSNHVSPGMIRGIQHHRLNRHRPCNTVQHSVVSCSHACFAFLFIHRRFDLISTRHYQSSISSSIP